MINKHTILIIDTGRQALPFIQKYHDRGDKVFVVGDSVFCEAFFSIYPSKKILWPKLGTKEFVTKLLGFIKTNHIDLILAFGDTSAEVLSKYKEEISQFSNVVQPDYSVFELATDKLLLMEYCMANKIPCPKTYSLTKETIEKNFYDINFPVIVKPRKGIGAIGVKKYDTPEDVINDYDKQIDRFGNMLIQEYIPQGDGVQYQAEAFLDDDNTVKACVILEKPRYFPVDGGTSSANYTLKNEEIQNTATSLLEGLKWKGAADIDFVFDVRDNKYKVLEINPRVTAGIKTAFKAGVDFASLHLDLALGKTIEPVINYKEGVYCRNIVLDTLWYIYSSKTERKRHKKSFWKFTGKNTCEQTFSIKDPFTFLGFVLHILIKYLSVNKLKEKFHK